jgi:hypothetical protein
MDTQRRLILGLVATIASLTAVGCATPAPLVRLSPLATNVAWLSGRAVVEKERAGIQVAVAFDEQVGDALGMRVEIQNGSDQRFDVAPRDVTFATCLADDKASCSPWADVADPERALLQIDAARSRERAQAVNDQQAMAPLLLLSAVGDVASVGSRHPTNNTAAVASDMDRDAAEHESAMSQLDAEHQRWSVDALRRTTLLPGGSVAGYVYIPIHPTAKRVWLAVLAGGQWFPFCFRQDVIPVGFPSNARARPR